VDSSQSSVVSGPGPERSTLNTQLSDSRGKGGANKKVVKQFPATLNLSTKLFPKNREFTAQTNLVLDNRLSPWSVGSRQSNLTAAAQLPRSSLPLSQNWETCPENREGFGGEGHLQPPTVNRQLTTMYKKSAQTKWFHEGIERDFVPTNAPNSGVQTKSNEMVRGNARLTADSCRLIAGH